MLKIKLLNFWFAALATIALLVGAMSCKKNDTASKPYDVDYYTCTMHPSVKLQQP
jgi:hypothetical protein